MRFWLLLAGLVYLVINACAQIRYCDTEIKMAYPDSGHYYISPGQDSVGYWVLNHGPDTFLAGDAFWLRIRLANVYFDPPTIVQLKKPIYPGDSARFTSSFALKYYNHRPEIDICLWLRVYEAAGNSKMFWEEDSTAMFADNLVCRQVAHNRLASTEDIASQQNTVYPNPFSDILHFKNVDGTLVVRSITGNTFYQGKPESINTQHWQSGVYIALITREDGTVHLKKLLKL